MWNSSTGVSKCSSIRRCATLIPTARCPASTIRAARSLEPGKPSSTITVCYATATRPIALWSTIRRASCILARRAVYFPRAFSRRDDPQTEYRSTLFGNLGYAILRDDLKYTLLDYGPHGGTHGHYDKLNLDSMPRRRKDNGDEMGGEPNFHFYDNPLHPTWTTTTVAHNTMAVDETSQTASEGKLLVYEDTPQLKIMRGESVGSYPGVLLDRTIIVTPDAVIDLFAGRSAIKRTWDRSFRYQGTMNAFPTTIGAPLGKSDGYQHLQVASHQPADKNWQGACKPKSAK